MPLWLQHFIPADLGKTADGILMHVTYYSRNSVIMVDKKMTNGNLSFHQKSEHN
jgi:hypothetical protein